MIGSKGSLGGGGRACPEELVDNRDFLLVIEGAVRRTELLLVLPNRLKLDSVEDGVVAEKHWQNQLISNLNIATNTVSPKLFGLLT